MENIRKHITDSLAAKIHNEIEPNSSIPAFGKPIVGIAAGDDPLFAFIKEDIGRDFYWTPADAFTLAFPEIKISPGQLSVISWILPHTKKTKEAQRKMDALPSREWSLARHYGEKVNERLRYSLVEYFTKNKIAATAPVLLDQWNRHLSKNYGYASSWSERHAAHVCGLGTFSLSDGLITSVGKAVRVGSVIVHKKLPPTPREYSSHNEWCLFYTTGKCLACARRCPAGAISAKGHDKEKCKKYIRSITAKYVEEEQLGFRVNSCGLCQTKVPCEARNPTSWGKKNNET